MGALEKIISQHWLDLLPGLKSNILRSNIFGKMSALLRSTLLKRLVFEKIEKSTILKRLIF